MFASYVSAVTERPPETVLINVTPQEIRVGVSENDQICEIHIERPQGRGLVGNIYLGVVKRVLPGMQSAFIDIGLEKAAFLHIVDVLSANKGNGRIEQCLFEGQVLPVQVIKDPIGNKGARLSTEISLAGRFLVYLPQDSRIAVSQRIEDEESRELQRARLESILPQNAMGGWIVRTSAEEANDTALALDMRYLLDLGASVRDAAQTQTPRTLLYHDMPLYLRVLRDVYTAQTQQILIDDESAYRQMLNFAQQYIPEAVEKISLYQSEATLFEAYGIEGAINMALRPRVNLNFGGYLIIERTEAMTVIDVNTGGFVGHHNFDETILKANLEACEAIARQLRLRNIGGMVVIDFIDMNNENHRELVLQKFADALSFDRTRITLNGFTSLGLVELTRKRMRESLSHMLSQSCPYCHGSGRVKTAQTVCYEIFRSMTQQTRCCSCTHVRVLASPTVVEMLIDEEAESLAELSELLGKEICLCCESSYSIEQFDIVLH